jgi:predicted transcriptional regulator
VAAGACFRSRLVGVSLTVHLPEDLARRVTEVAEARHVSPEQVAIESIEAQLPARRRLSFSGIGSSGSARGGAEADELIAEHFAGKTASDV